ncbi:hypothetical protein PR202_ga06044 [Eleusine coracana subsp. coracana]|uniref:Uncharacterized protein n=1 Tax=Eleusine coracana subsp. coracana TaxID=191504 RepID=A0AAV5BW73_ELECO|nr:hypothetical protein PR202_ga06044 [Eleusine coracana subsp. coracana]
MPVVLKPECIPAAFVHRLGQMTVCTHHFTGLPLGCFVARYPPLTPEQRAALFDGPLRPLFALPVDAKRRNYYGESATISPTTPDQKFNPSLLRRTARATAPTLLRPHPRQRCSGVVAPLPARTVVLLGCSPPPPCSPARGTLSGVLPSPPALGSPSVPPWSSRAAPAPSRHRLARARLRVASSRNGIPLDLGEPSLFILDSRLTLLSNHQMQL